MSLLSFSITKFNYVISFVWHAQKPQYLCSKTCLLFCWTNLSREYHTNITSGSGKRTKRQQHVDKMRVAIIIQNNDEIYLTTFTNRMKETKRNERTNERTQLAAISVESDESYDSQHSRSFWRFIWVDIIRNKWKCFCYLDLRCRLLWNVRCSVMPTAQSKSTGGMR